MPRVHTNGEDHFKVVFWGQGGGGRAMYHVGIGGGGGSIPNGLPLVLMGLIVHRENQNNTCTHAAYSHPTPEGDVANFYLRRHIEGKK